MKFAICNETFQDWPFDKAFAFARECGYTGIEIAPFTMALDAREISAAQRTEVRRQAEAADLTVIGLHWLLAKTKGFYLTTPDADVRRSTGAYIEELARLCRDLGGSVMVLGSPLQRNLLPNVTMDQAMGYAAEVLASTMPTLEKLDVTLAVEPLGPADGNFLNTAAERVKLCEMVGSPNCRLHLDCKAMSGMAEGIEGTLRRYGAAASHFHTNCPDGKGPGMGELDFIPIFAALRDSGYQGWVSTEPFDYSPDSDTVARTALETLRYAASQNP